jgi:hypothetical protein
MIVKIRTRDNLNDILANGQSGNWKIAQGLEGQISKVQIWSFDGREVLEADFNPANSKRLPNGRLVVGIVNGNITASEIKWPWRAPVVYGAGIEIYDDQGTKVGVVRGNNSLPMNQQQVEDYFKRLEKDILLELPQKVIFQGGGQIQIPEEFREFCRRNGIEIEILDEEELNRRYLPQID